MEENKIIIENVVVKKDSRLTVLLVCGSGASSSFMAAKMRIAAKNRDLDLNLLARSESEISNFVGEVDAVMIGPHLSQYYEDLKNHYKDEFVTILMKTDYYSCLDGEKAIEHLIEELEKTCTNMVQNNSREKNENLE